MRIFAALRALFVLGLSLALVNAWAATGSDVDKVMSQGGLQKISVKGIELAYARPGATLAAYKGVMIDPVEVAFSKSWDPYRPGGRFKLNSQEKEDIRTGVVKLVREEFVKELSSKGSYQIATEPGPGVLRVKLNIVNLYINAPDADGFNRARSVAPSAGEMTLVAELFDATSGQVLARVADRREAGSTIMQLNGNEQEGRAIAASWARIMRQALDKAHTGIGK